MRLLAVAAALLLAGCAAAPAREGGAPTLLPPPADDPAALCGHPDPEIRECPYPWAAPPCVQLSAEARRDHATSYVIRGQLVNACQDPFWHQGTNMGESERGGMRATLLINGTTYHLASGAAWYAPTTAPAIPPGMVVGPGSPVLAEWTWNGTLAAFDSECACSFYTPAEAGEHVVKVELARDPSVTASATIRVE